MSHDTSFLSTEKLSIQSRPYTTVTRQTGEYKVDVTRHPKFPLAFGELASGGFPHCNKVKKMMIKSTTLLFSTLFPLRNINVDSTLQIQRRNCNVEFWLFNVTNNFQR
jgi:hypothetical protein